MMRSRNIIATALLCTSLAGFSRAAQVSLDGQWEGVLSREGSEAKVTLNFKDKQGPHEGTMTMLSVGMFRQPLTKIAYRSSKVHFEQENLAAVFDGEIRTNTINGNLQIIGLNGEFHLQRSKDEPLPYRQEEVRFRNGSVSLAGTLTTPLTPRVHTAIVFSRRRSRHARPVTFLRRPFCAPWSRLANL